jgi:hypothetical protein
MTDWVVVNGARIERSFLEGAVAEVRRHSWQSTTWEGADKGGDHAHSEVCSCALSGRDSCYRSKAGWLCPHCFQAFVA